jgi:dihydrofolate synthase/folylpolyglutamate synthase
VHEAEHEFGEALRYLDRHAKRWVMPGLERMEWLCAHLDHPERTAPAVHITGTNGKGSTARLISALLGAAGRVPGLFTSPHFEDITERVVVADSPISHDEFATLMRRLAPLFNRVAAEVSFGPTYL